MKRIMILFLVALNIALVAIADAAEVQGISITDFGTVSEEGRDPEIAQHTDRIRAVLGTRFGVRYVVKGAAQDQEVRIGVRWVHPPIQAPGVNVPATTEDVMVARRTGTTWFAGYAFTASYELVPGVWKIELYFEGRKLAEQTFTVFAP